MVALFRPFFDGCCCRSRRLEVEEGLAVAPLRSLLDLELDFELDFEPDFELDFEPGDFELDFEELRFFLDFLLLLLLGVK